MNYNLNSRESNGAETYKSVDEQCLLRLEESIGYGMERVESGAMISHLPDFIYAAWDKGI